MRDLVSETTLEVVFWLPQVCLLLCVSMHAREPERPQTKKFNPRCSDYFFSISPLELLVAVLFCFVLSSSPPSPRLKVCAPMLRLRTVHSQELCLQELSISTPHNSLCKQPLPKRHLLRETSFPPLSSLTPSYLWVIVHPLAMHV